MRMTITSVYVLIGLAFYGCATTSVREAVGTKYTSDIPPLKIEFAYNIANAQNKGNDKLIHFYSNKVRDVYVELYRLKVNDNNIDYYYSVQGIASNLGYHYHGPVYFDDHQWAKVTKVNEDGWLMCGFITRKDKWLLFIHNSAKLTRLEMERYQEYRSTLKFAEQDKRFIDILFADLNKTIIAIQ